MSCPRPLFCRHDHDPPSLLSSLGSVAPPSLVAVRLEEIFLLQEAWRVADRAGSSKAHPWGL